MSMINIIFSKRPGGHFGDIYKHNYRSIIKKSHQHRGKAYGRTLLKLKSADER